MCRPLTETELRDSDTAFTEYVKRNHLDVFDPLMTLLRDIAISGGDARQMVHEFLMTEGHRCDMCGGRGSVDVAGADPMQCPRCHGIGNY